MTCVSLSLRNAPNSGTFCMTVLHAALGFGDVWLRSSEWLRHWERTCLSSSVIGMLAILPDREVACDADSVGMPMMRMRKLLTCCFRVSAQAASGRMLRCWRRKPSSCSMSFINSDAMLAHGTAHYISVHSSGKLRASKRPARHAAGMHALQHISAIDFISCCDHRLQIYMLQRMP